MPAARNGMRRRQPRPAHRASDGATLPVGRVRRWPSKSPYALAQARGKRKPPGASAENRRTSARLRRGRRVIFASSSGVRCLRCPEYSVLIPVGLETPAICTLHREVGRARHRRGNRTILHNSLLSHQSPIMQQRTVGRESRQNSPRVLLVVQNATGSANHLT